jgi:hypothetical protein
MISSIGTFSGSISFNRKRRWRLAVIDVGVRMESIKLQIAKQKFRKTSRPYQMKLFITTATHP